MLAINNEMLIKEDASRPQHDPRNDRKDMRRLSRSFTPGAYDVICARGAKAKNHNKFLKRKIREESEAYTKATCKLYKSLIVSSIIEWVRQKSPNGGFVKQLEDGVWYEVGDAMAREKVGQAFRDLNHTHYKSSMKAKRQRWRKEQLRQREPKWINADFETCLVEGPLQQKIQCHQETIQLILQCVEHEWIEHGVNADDELLLESFTQHNRDLLEMLKKDKPQNGGALITNSPDVDMCDPDLIDSSFPTELWA